MIPLQISQQAFTVWLEHVDALLAESVVGFVEFTDKAKAGDLTGAGKALGEAETKVREVRAEIAAGLRAGYDAPTIKKWKGEV